MPWERGRPARILFLWPPLSFSAMLQAATLSAGTAAASPHFSPGGAIMAQEFSPQRVLASEGRSGDTIRASMCALRGKGQARARPAQSVPRRLQSKNRKMLKTSTFRHCAQRPGEKCGPGRRRAMAPFPVDPSGGDGRGCAKQALCGRDARAPRKLSSHDIVTPRAQYCRSILVLLATEGGPSVFVSLRVDSCPFVVHVH